VAYRIDISETLERKLKKLRKKNNTLFMACRKKISEIVENPRHYKHLKYEDRFRVHVGGSFVMTFRVFEKEKAILFLDVEHHDRAYR
jgi:mRNA-degrading endonuclease RelE of RelBE toxin-antitoxin system